MSNVSAKRRDIADLWSRDQITGFCQRPGMCDDQRIVNDTIDRDGGTDEELIPSHFERVHLLDGCHVQQGVHRSMPALFKVEQ